MNKPEVSFVIERDEEIIELYLIENKNGTVMAYSAISEEPFALDCEEQEQVEEYYNQVLEDRYWQNKIDIARGK
jgi:hypothetical protein